MAVKFSLYCCTDDQHLCLALYFLLQKSQKSLITQSIFNLGYLQSYDITFPTLVKMHRMLLLIKTYSIWYAYYTHLLLIYDDILCFISGWGLFMRLGWLALTFSASSAPCTISAGLWWPPMFPMRECSRPPSRITSTWVCCSSSCSSVYYL